MLSVSVDHVLLSQLRYRIGFAAKNKDGEVESVSPEKCGDCERRISFFFFLNEFVVILKLSVLYFKFMIVLTLQVRNDFSACCPLSHFLVVLFYSSF